MKYPENMEYGIGDENLFPKEAEKLRIFRIEAGKIADYLDPSDIKGPADFLWKLENAQKEARRVVVKIYPSFAQASREPEMRHLVIQKKMRRVALTFFILCVIWAGISYFFGLVPAPKTGWAIVCTMVIPFIFLLSSFWFHLRRSSFVNP